MTEAEWLASEDPQALLDWLRDSNTLLPFPIDRKLRLFACASKDGTDCPWDYGEEGEKIQGSVIAVVRAWTEWPGRWKGEKTKPQLASLLRDVVGNPFRPVSYSTENLGKKKPCPTCRHWDGYNDRCPTCGGTSVVEGNSWLTPTVLAIARRAYDERDFESLPILADALEDAGCSEWHLLAHLRWGLDCNHAYHFRGRTPDRPCPQCQDRGWIERHVRGCWALDLILGKE